MAQQEEEVQELISDPQFVDDFYFSALSNENEDQLYPISDSKYAEELQFQEALMSSVLICPQSSSNPSPVSQLLLKFSKTPEPEAETQIAESSHSFCEICVEKKESDQMFRVDNCSHSFCSDCVSKHVTIKIHENFSTVVTCPGWDCDGVLEIESCRTRISEEVVARWEEVLCEAMIPVEEKFYCPFKDCSAMMVREEEKEEEEGIRESECPVCHRLFCARCYVGWHSGIECEDFQELNEDERGREDLMVRELARSNSWMRCPHCKFYVEKTEGCLHMNCRCGFQFCYACGATWGQTHGGCRP